MPANMVFRRKIWGARDNGIPPRSTPGELVANLNISESKRVSCCTGRSENDQPFGINTNQTSCLS